MKQKININAVNQIPKGVNIFTEGEPLNSIALLIKGRVQVYHDGVKYVMGSGHFLAVSDIVLGEYQSTYTALEDVIIYVFGVEHKEDIERILSINRDYSGFIVASMYKVINELGETYQGLIKHGQSLYQFLTDSYKLYLESASRRGYTARKPQWLEHLNAMDRDLEPDIDKINFYSECMKVPIDVIKSFYATSSIITTYQLEDQIELINQLNKIVKDYTNNLFLMSDYLIGKSDTSLFELFAAYAIEIVNSGGNGNEFLDIMDNIIEKINILEDFSEKRLGKKIQIDRNKMMDIYHLINTGTKDKELSAQTYIKYSVEEAEKVLANLKNSFMQIIEYAGIDEERSKEMQSVMSDFVNLKDRLSTEDHARIIRKQLTDIHYELYKVVFLKAYHDDNIPRIIDMFLKYGYADERLLTPEQILSLYFLNEEEAAGYIQVYNIKEWLTLIYEGKKEPSKNEFDQEYTEVLLSMKKRGAITEKQVKEYSEDKERRLEYEIQNMFRYNNRITSGQISTFIPVIHKDVLISMPDKSYVTPKKIMEAMDKLLEIDYSIFDREILYVNESKKIEKEYIIKTIFPDIILMPTVGTNGIMWQDISGKRRGTPGRFVFPILCEADIFLNMVKVCGRFRWEMCRTIEGIAWNDIKNKSLTSEYSDYLQFYRKNKDLSEEKKEKLKLQIQKGRNNSREIFVIDYEAWINYEANGAIKLNKVAREILATYCPFSKKIRDQLSMQPLFQEAYARFNKNRQKKIKEVEGRYRMLQKESIELTEELINTLNYYKET